jgi:hypothetical protein
LSSHILSILDPIKAFVFEISKEFSDEYEVHTTGYRHGYSSGYNSESTMESLSYLGPDDVVGPRDFAGFGIYLRAYTKGYTIGLDDRKRGRSNRLMSVQHG